MKQAFQHLNADETLAGKLPGQRALEAGPTVGTVSRDITWHEGTITQRHRAILLRQEPAAIWLTGLSGSGKSTIAFELERRLIERGHACFVLDGDNIRQGLNRDLGFAPRERKENIRRIAEVAKLFNDAGLFVIAAFISPYREDREIARSIIGKERFVETYLTANLDVCESRDAKGLYAKARAGLIPDFTGVSAPYEAPWTPALSLDSGSWSVNECAAQVIEFVSERFR